METHTKLKQLNIRNLPTKVVATKLSNIIFLCTLMLAEYVWKLEFHW